MSGLVGLLWWRADKQCQELRWRLEESWWQQRSLWLLTVHNEFPQSAVNWVERVELRLCLIFFSLSQRWNKQYPKIVDWNNIFIFFFLVQHFTQVCQSKRKLGERTETLLSCQSPFRTPFSSVELCWMEKGLFSEVSFSSDWNYAALNPKPQSWAAITIIYLLLFFIYFSWSLSSLCSPSFSVHLLLHYTVFTVTLSLFFYT